VFSFESIFCNFHMVRAIAFREAIVKQTSNTSSLYFIA
jgi:hypothetical protein